MFEVVARVVHSPCFAPLRIFAVGSVTAVVALLLADFLYSRRASDGAERRRRFITAWAAVLAFFGATYLFMFAEVCALGPACSNALDLNCNGRSADVYRVAAALLSFTSLAILCMELVRQVGSQREK